MNYCQAKGHIIYHKRSKNDDQLAFQSKYFGFQRIQPKAKSHQREILRHNKHAKTSSLEPQFLLQPWNAHLLARQEWNDPCYTPSEDNNTSTSTKISQANEKTIWMPKHRKLDRNLGSPNRYLIKQKCNQKNSVNITPSQTIHWNMTASTDTNTNTKRGTNAPNEPFSFPTQIKSTGKMQHAITPGSQKTKCLLKKQHTRKTNEILSLEWFIIFISMHYCTLLK